MKVIIFTCLLALALAAPRPEGNDATIVESTNDNDGNGNYKWSYQSSDGIQQDQTGALKTNPDPKGTDIQTVVGSFTYKDPKTGRSITTTYTADENGYRPKTTIS